jgi:hypothetical protein
MEKFQPMGVENMDSKLKKKLPAVAHSLVAVTSLLNAADDMQMRNLDNRVTALEKRKVGSGMINPPARPIVTDGVDLWFQAEALCMQAATNGLEYAIRRDSTTTPTFIVGNAKNATFKWNWGFRAGMGINLPHDGWDILANYTWFRARRHNNQSTVLAVQSIAPTETNLAADPEISVQSAQAHIKLTINMVDVELGREFFVSKWLTLRPHAGVRGAWITQNYDVNYAGGTLGTTVLDTDAVCKFKGFGLRAGLDSQWGLGSGVSIFAQVSLSNIWGRFRTQSKDNRITAAGVNTSEYNVKDNYRVCRVISDLALGLRWDKLFSNDSYRIRLQLGWEQHMFFGLNQFIKSISQKLANNRGDMTLHGLAFQARFDF